MVDKLNYTNILRRDYNFYTSLYFFGFGDDDYSSDPIRIVKLLYILISFILNLLIVLSILKKKKKNFSIALILTGNILLMNFIHTFSYSFEWILKENDDNHIRTLYINDNGTKNYNEDNYTESDSSKYYEVGGLLVGNLNNPAACVTQGFLLVFSALSQDILINIFFFILNLPKIPSRLTIRIYLIFLGYCVPLLISFIYLAVKGYGINDKFCYINKFGILNEGYIPYKFNGSFFRTLLYIIYGIRTTNLAIGLFLIYKIIRYVKLNNLKKIYILKSSAILIIQVITIFIGLIYRIGSSINENFSRYFSRIFLCINTIDGILFPLSYSLSNGIYQNLFCISTSKDSLENNDEMLMNSKMDNSSFNIKKVPTNEKTLAMVDLKNDNNFDLSYA